jgi:hypothetical protein
MPRGGFLYTAPCPLENTTPAVKTSFEATSKPGRAHFESTWLEKARKRRENRPRSCFGGRLGHSKTPHLPSNRASRPLRSQCHQIWPQGHFEATSSPLRDHLARTHSKTPRKPASKPLSKSLGPLENTAPAIKSGLARRKRMFARERTFTRIRMFARIKKLFERPLRESCLGITSPVSHHSASLHSVRYTHGFTLVYIYICVYILHIIQISSRH